MTGYGRAEAALGHANKQLSSTSPAPAPAPAMQAQSGMFISLSWTMFPVLSEYQFKFNCIH